VFNIKIPELHFRYLTVRDLVTVVIQFERKSLINISITTAIGPWIAQLHNVNTVSTTTHLDIWSPTVLTVFLYNLLSPVEVKFQAFIQKIIWYEFCLDNHAIITLSEVEASWNVMAHAQISSFRETDESI